ncbi:hypothetical protein ABE527_20355 [Brucella sp. TWI432]
MSDVKPKLEVKINLDFPVPVKGTDGKEATRDSVTMRRPRTVHVKRLAVLLGADILKGIIGDQEPSAVKIDKDNVDMGKLAVDVISKVFDYGVLDELTKIIASMCDEEPAFIDQIDPFDLVKFAQGLVDFFPALRSFASTSSEQTQQPASAGDQTT